MNEIDTRPIAYDICCGLGGWTIPLLEEGYRVIGFDIEAHDYGTGNKMGGDWFSDPTSTCRRHGSKSPARKAASAMIAKIPYPLAQHIARTFKPQVIG